MDDGDLELGADDSWLCAGLVPEADLSGARLPRRLAIAPSNGDRWTFAALAVLLNQRTAQWSLEDSTRLSTTVDGDS
jgi:hypothetical protein